MEVKRIRGVVDRIVNKVVVIVPDDRTRELYISGNDIHNPQEGLKVDLLIVLNDDPNGISKVFSRKRVKPVKPIKFQSFSSLVRTMIKTKERLRATLIDLEKEENSKCERAIEEAREKIEFLEKGIRLFS